MQSAITVYYFEIISTLLKSSGLISKLEVLLFLISAFCLEWSIRYFFQFYCCKNFCHYKNFGGLISNMITLLSDSNPRIPKSGIFGPKLKDFQICTKLAKRHL